MSNKNKHLPIFSVIVPIYNMNKYLDRCVSSIVNQTVNNYEVILVNDGSTDNSLEICNNWKKQDTRVTVINKSNGGLVSARNAGLFKAVGDYVIYVDSDDSISHRLIETLNGTINKYDSPDMIIYNFTSIYDNNKEKNNEELKKGLYVGDELLSLQNNLFGKFSINLNSCRSAYKRKLLLQHYCRDERIVRGEDYAYTYEYFLSSQSVYYLSESFYNYNKQNNNSIMNSQMLGFKEIVILFNYMFKNLLPINNNIYDNLLNYYVGSLTLYKNDILLFTKKMQFNKKISYLYDVYKECREFNDIYKNILFVIGYNTNFPKEKKNTLTLFQKPFLLVFVLCINKPLSMLNKIYYFPGSVKNRIKEFIKSNVD